MRLRRHWQILLTLVIPWGVFFFWVFIRLLEFTPQGVFVRHQHVWSDWGLHISMVQRFAYTPVSIWFEHNPAYAYGKFTYPFFVNLISGLLIRGGFSLWAALILPSLLTVSLLLWGLYLLGYQITRSRRASVLSIWIFFFSSGMKGMGVIVKSLASGHWHSLLSLSTDPSAIPAYSWWTGNIISGMILPQRAFLLGMTVGVWTMIGLLVGLHEKRRQWLLVLSGSGLGLLPIVHVHSFLVVGVVSAVISLSRTRSVSRLVWYWTPAVFIAGVLILRFIVGGVSSHHFFTLSIGWNAPSGVWNWIMMWWNLWGIAIPAALIAWYWRCRQMNLMAQLISIALTIIFVCANCLLMQPNSWDNSKLFAWVYLGIAWLLSPALLTLWSKNILAKIATLILCICLMGTGALEVLRVINIPDNRYMLNSTAEIQMAEYLRTTTDPSALFLTAPVIHQPIMDWAPRQVLMSYWAWAWNYGFDHEGRTQDIATMYRGGEKSARLLSRYHVSYVVIGPAELVGESVDLSYFAQFPLVYDRDHYRIYDVRSVWDRED